MFPLDSHFPSSYCPLPLLSFITKLSKKVISFCLQFLSSHYLMNPLQLDSHVYPTTIAPFFKVIGDLHIAKSSSQCSDLPYYLHSRQCFTQSITSSSTRNWTSRISSWFFFLLTDHFPAPYFPKLNLLYCLGFSLQTSFLPILISIVFYGFKYYLNTPSHTSSLNFIFVYPTA